MPGVLYLGLRPPTTWEGLPVYHFPMIRIRPRPFHSSSILRMVDRLPLYESFLFTSQTAVEIFSQILRVQQVEWPEKPHFAVGKATGAALQQAGIQGVQISQEETAEGLIASLPREALDSPTCFLWPHAAGARRVIRDSFASFTATLDECVLYDTLPHLPDSPPPWDKVDRILFTSPSTLDSFFHFFPLPPITDFHFIGPITRKEFEKNYLL